MTTENQRGALEDQWKSWWVGTKYCQVVSIGYTDGNLIQASYESYEAGYKQAMTTAPEVEGLDQEVCNAMDDIKLKAALEWANQMIRNTFGDNTSKHLKTLIRAATANKAGV